MSTLTAEYFSPSSNSDIAALLDGVRWTSGPGDRTVITYSFGNTSSQYDAAQAAFSSTKTEFSAQDKAMTREVLSSIAAVCKVAFVEVADSGAQCGAVRYAYSEQPNKMGFSGYAFEPSTSEVGGNVWLGQAQSGREWEFARKFFIVHETGHALGMGHPFEGASALSTAIDIIPNTVMSYSPVAGSTSGSLSSYPSAPMVLDIAALQELYGAADFNTGNTSYNLAEAGFQSFRALWDSHGTDTLDASACAAGVNLDLAPGARSEIGATVQAFAYQGSGASQTFTMSNYTDTLTIARGADIENATGSQFADVIFGNALANVIHGGAGNDLIDGRGSNDSLFGDAGNDTFRIGAGSATIDDGQGIDTAVFSGSLREFKTVSDAGTYTVTRLSDAGNVTVLRNVEHIEFSDTSMAATQSDAVALPTNALAGQAFRLYQAALDRTPDADGLAFQTRTLESGVSLAQLASNFMASPEFSQHYGPCNDFQFVANLYNNVLDRTPDGAGLLWHVDRIQHQGVSRADVLVSFSESPENQAKVIGSLQAGEFAAS